VPCVVFIYCSSGKRREKTNSEATASADNKVIWSSCIKEDSGRHQSDLNREGDRAAQIVTEIRCQQCNGKGNI